MPGDSAYIESHRADGHNYGCSFIEFDGKGSFLGEDQFENALKVLDTRKARSDVLLVIYCHGWMNNAQSGDVLHFVSLLRRLADSSSIRSQNLRVEGVYLGWRGAQYLPVINRTNDIDPQLHADFGAELTDPKWNNSKITDAIISPARYLSYWSIKDRAEFHVSRVPLARAVFNLAFKLKSPTEEQNGRHHRVFVIGHSFGALLLEQAIGQASVGLINSEWNQEKTLDARWPFDLIVFLNSAAPSIYAKQLGEFLQLDHKTSARPRIVSITSTGDWATGIFHPLGNWAKRFAPDLQRGYHPFGNSGPAVPAWQYYDLTPGHNQYLINRVVERTTGPVPTGMTTEDTLFSRNLRADNPRNTFYTELPDGTVQAWIIREPSDPQANSEAHEARKQYASNYWIATVPPEIIKDHLLSSKDTNGAYAVVESVVVPGCSPPMHLHRNEEEHFVVLAGTYRILIEDRVFDAPAGTSVTIPRGSRHSWRNISNETSRLLVVLAPGGFEKCIQTIRDSPADKILEIAAHYGCFIVGHRSHRSAFRSSRPQQFQRPAPAGPRLQKVRSA